MHKQIMQILFHVQNNAAFLRMHERREPIQADAQITSDLLVNIGLRTR